MLIGCHIDFTWSGKHGTKSYTHDHAMLSKNACQPSWNANLIRLSHVIALVMDIRAFLSSKVAKSSEQGSYQTTKTSTLKRGSGDSGSSTSQSSSKRNFVQTWHKDLPCLTYDFEANVVCSQMSQALKKYCTVKFSRIMNCIFNMTTHNACYVV